MKSQSLSRALRSSLALSCGIYLTSCTFGPDYVQPEVDMPQAFPGSQESSTKVELEQWWKTFQDPLLEALLQEALVENLDLKLAEARIRSAQAELSIANSSLFPQPQTNGSATRSKTSANVAQGRAQATGTTSGSTTGGTTTGTAGNLQQSPGSTANLFRTGFDSTWELDLFGRIRSQIEVSSSLLEAQIETRNGAFITLFAEIARNYIELRGYQHQKEIVEKNIALQADSLEIQRTRLSAGISSELAVAQAESQLAQTRSELPPLDLQVQKSIHRLSILMGKEPKALEARLRERGPVPVGPSAIDPGLPSDLLRRRPDIRASEMRLRAATAQIGVAVADLFPKFSLTGSLGLQSRQTSSLIDASSFFWSLGSSVNWAILSWPAIQANIALQDSKQEEAFIQYQQLVLNALEEVDNAIVAYEQEQKRQSLLREAVASTRRSFDLAVQLNDAGVVEFINVLQAEQAVSEAERQLSISDQQVSTNLLAVYKALGGGWQQKDSA